MLVEMAVFQYDRPPSFWIVGFHELLQILKNGGFGIKRIDLVCCFFTKKIYYDGKTKRMQ